MTEREYDLRLYEGGAGDKSMYLPTLCELPRSFTEKTGLRLVKLFKGLSLTETAEAFMEASLNRHETREVAISEIEKAIEGKGK